MSEPGGRVKLPATQQAVLVLRDVLAMPAAETLHTSVASVNSALQRARQRYPAAARR